MAPFSRRLARYELPVTAALALGLVFVAVLAAYGFAAYSVPPSPGGLLAGLGVVVVAGSGLLYAWRPVPGGHGD